jgi:hypothetical protein
MASLSGPFKHQERGQRVQTSETLFNKGMYFSNMPLEEGFVKELVNYDMREQGQMLTPRPGLRAFDYSLHTGATPYDEDMTISYAKSCVEEDNQVHQQVLLGVLSDDNLEGTDLVIGEGYVGTGGNNTLELSPLHGVGSSLIFKRPSIGEIHGTPVADLKAAGKQIGTFAFNDDFYFFKTDGKLYRTQFNLLTSKYEPVEVPPRPIDAKEAVLWGYNILSADPYTFADKHLSPLLLLGGIMISDDEGPVFTPMVNQTVTLRAQYDVVNGEKYTLLWQWKEFGSDTWNTIPVDNNVVTFSNSTVLEAQFESPAEKVIIQLTAYRWVGGVQETNPMKVLPMAVSFKKQMLGEFNTIRPVTYNLHTASGLAYWKRRLVVYGIRENRNIIFVSNPDDPEYFPFPNNMDDFDEPVIHVTSIKDELLVFTTTKIYTIVLSPDGMTWTKTMLQDKLSINEWDTHLIQNIKNMVYFRSGDYYYMIVPSRMLIGNLTVAPISKNLEEFFNKFDTNIANIVRSVHDYSQRLTLVSYYNYLDFEDVCNCYVYQTDVGVYLNVVLLYNTMLRSWRIHTYESQNILIPYKQDVTRRGELVSLWNFNNKPALQFLRPDPLLVPDFYYPMEINSLETAEVDFAAQNVFKNYQYVDTGYRELSSDYKKRFREIQLKIHNLSEERLNFYTEFLIDGYLRSSKFRYFVAHTTDPQDPNYGLITMDRELVDPTVVPIVVPGTTILADTEDDVNMWQLDVSMFPDLAFWKARIPVSGKGYAPRMRLVSYNEARYELLNLNWVFRPLYSR